MLPDTDLIRLAFLTHLPLHVSTWARLLGTESLNEESRAVLMRWVLVRYPALQSNGASQHTGA